MNRRSHKTPFTVIFNSIIFLMLVGLANAGSNSLLGSTVNISGPSNTTPVILNVTLNITNLNTNYSYIWEINFSDNQSDIKYWVQPWGQNWLLDNGTLLYLSNNTLRVNYTHMSFPIDDNVTIKDMYAFSDSQVLNLSVEGYYDGWGGIYNLTYQQIMYNSTFYNRATDPLNILWSHESIIGGVVEYKGSGSVLNLIGTRTNFSSWSGDWVNDSWGVVKRLDDMNSTMNDYCWQMQINITSFIYNVNFTNFNFTLSMLGANFTVGTVCPILSTQLINYVAPFSYGYSNFSTPSLVYNVTIVTNGTFVYPTYTEHRFEIDLNAAYPTGVNRTFLDSYYKNITVIIGVQNESNWSLFEWDGFSWVEANISGVNFTLPDPKRAQWNILNISHANKTYRVVGTTGGPPTPSAQPPGGGVWFRPSPFLPNPLFKVTPRTIDSVLGNIIEPFYSYGRMCKLYMVRNIGLNGGLFTLTKQGYTYQLPNGNSVNSADLYKVEADEIYLIPNATGFFKICVNNTFNMGFDSYVVASGGGQSEKILLFMNPPRGEYVEQSLVSFLQLIVWESPRGVNGAYFDVRVWHLLTLVVVMLLFIISLYIIRSRSMEMYT